MKKLERGRTENDSLGKNHKSIQVNLCQKLLFLHQLTHNMTTYCGLVDARISAPEKDLPVLIFP